MKSERKYKIKAVQNPIQIEDILAVGEAILALKPEAQWRAAEENQEKDLFDAAIPYEIKNLVLSYLYVNDLNRLRLVSKAHNQLVNNFLSSQRNLIFALKEVRAPILWSLLRRQLKSMPPAFTEENKTIWHWLSECLTGNVLTIDIEKASECWSQNNREVPGVIADLFDRQIQLIRTLQRPHHELHSSKIIPRQFYLRDFSNLNFSGANLERAVFNHSDLKGSNFEKANLRRAIFMFVNLNNAKFTSADLRNVVIRNTDMIKADLRQADLRGVDFAFANMHAAQLDNANFKHANIVIFFDATDFRDSVRSNKLCESIITILSRNKRVDTYGLFHAGHREKVKHTRDLILDQFEVAVTNLIENNSIEAMRLCKSTLEKLNDKNVFQEHKKGLLHIKRREESRVEQLIERLDNTLKQEKDENKIRKTR